MGGRVTRAVAYLALAAMIGLTSCQAVVAPMVAPFLRGFGA